VKSPSAPVAGVRSEHKHVEFVGGSEVERHVVDMVAGVARAGRGVKLQK
jgi:hypothetical protein